ncbi:MAG TPA: hypothetical protein VH084_29200 [Mycobacterium sp.]|jgi:hypothetical protein|nr:hypothetical protein [Mycobacterium sp.]
MRKAIIAALAPLAILAPAAAHADPDDNPYGHNGPCNSNDVHISKITPRGNAIEVWGPRGCDPSLPMTGTN